MSRKAYIGMGSNLGDGKTILMDAWDALNMVDGIHTKNLSRPYLTAPVDMTSQHWFTNAVGCLDVSLEPLELLHSLLDIETSFGRVRDDMTFGYQDRSLDLDLLFFGDVIMDTPELVLPHPHFRDRLFVLTPLAEIEPGFVDIITGKSVDAMISSLQKNIGSSQRKEQEIIAESWNE